MIGVPVARMDFKACKNAAYRAVPAAVALSMTLWIFAAVFLPARAISSLMYLLGYNMSVAVGVGFIALAGVAAEIGVIMLVYLDMSYVRRQKAGRLESEADLTEAILEEASLRIRPIMMTVCAIIGGLLPILWGSGTGSEVMKKIAAPMVGGMVTATVLTLVVISAIYAIWKGGKPGRN